MFWKVTGFSQPSPIEVRQLPLRLLGIALQRVCTREGRMHARLAFEVEAPPSSAANP